MQILTTSHTVGKPPSVQHSVQHSKRSSKQAQRRSQHNSALLPPNSLEAEQAVLGAMLMDASAVKQAVSCLSSNDFYRENHRRIFKSITTLYAQGKPIDLITVNEALRSSNQLEDCGGPAYLTAIIEACPCTQAIDAYVQILAVHSQRRHAIAYAEKIQTLAYSTSDEDATELVLALREAQEIAKQVSFSSNNRFTFKTLEQLEIESVRQQLIHGILPANALVCLIGEYAAFKSFIALDIALSIATGQPWHSSAINAEQNGALAYIAAEGAAEFRKRVRAWCIRHGVGKLSNAYFLGDAPQLTKPEDTGDLITQIAALPVAPALIVIDTLARCAVGADENAQKDMGLFVAACDRLRRATGATVMVLHHAGKDGTLRGSTALPAACDTILKAKRSGDFVTVQCDKQKDFAEFEPIRLIKRVVELGDGQTSIVFDKSHESKQPTIEVCSEKVRLLLEALAAFPSGATYNQWLETSIEHGIKKGSFQRYFTAAKSYITIEESADEATRLYRIKAVLT